jgi:cell division inhibitor SulA
MLHTNINTPRLLSDRARHSNVNIVRTVDDINANLELLKIIHLCNKKHGWILLIAPENIPNKAVLESCSIDSSKLIVIKQKHISDLQYVLNAALSHGNFAAIITWTKMTTATQLDNMNLNTSDTELFCFSDVQGKDKCTIGNMIS